MNTHSHTKTFTLVMLASLLTVGTSAFAYTAINSQLDLGERNVDVTNLQTFFADNAAIYPEKLITGYFGSLTAQAVNRFQAAYNFDQVGRVGPLTRDKINELISTGGWAATDVTGPAFTSISQSVSNTQATFTWNTNEMATGKVWYSTTPVTMSEGDINSVGFGPTSGATANNDNLARTSQQVTLGNLTPNTLYYYVVVSTDMKGNVSVVGPNNTFRTNQ